MPKPTSSLQSRIDLPIAELYERRERVFLVLAGLFLATLAMLNILGISRFIYFASWGVVEGETVFRWFAAISPEQDPNAWTFAVAIGVLPYPITFLCTDLISEFYGRRRANFLVLVGLIVNGWVMLVIWLAGALPGNEAAAFFAVRELAFGAVTASMIAYLLAQFIDVQVFHFWKRMTGGRWLWLRNNGSTLVSQAVDTVAVITITYLIGGLNWRIEEDTHVPMLLAVLILTGYVFKLVAALLDTPLIYLAARWLGPYLGIDPSAEPRVDAGGSRLTPSESPS